MAVDVVIRTTITGAVAVQASLRGIGTSIASLQRVGRDVSKSLDQVGTSMRSLGTTLSVGITAPLALVTKSLIGAASAAAESESLFEVSMGEMADEARAFSEELRTQFGLNSFEVRRMMGVINNMVTSMGVSTEAAFEMSKAIVQLTNDFASFFDKTTEEAFEKIRSGITGEIEPLKQLGIVVNAVAVENALLTRGLIEQGETLDETQKVYGRLLAIIDQSANAQGDLARTLTSPANQFRVLSARIEETKIQLGNALIPAASAFTAMIQNKVLPAIQRAVEWFNNLSQSEQGQVIATVALVAAAGPLLIVLGSMIKTLAALVAIISSPVGLALAGLVGAFGLVVTSGDLIVASWDKISAKADLAFTNVQLQATRMADSVLSIARDLVSIWPGAFEEIGIAAEDLSFEDEVKRLEGQMRTATLAVEGATVRVRTASEEWGTDIAGNFDRMFGTDFEETINDALGFIDDFMNQTVAGSEITAEDVVANMQGMVGRIVEGFEEYRQAAIDANIAASEEFAKTGDAIEEVVNKTTNLKSEFASISQTIEKDAAQSARDAKAALEETNEQVTTGETLAKNALTNITSGVGSMVQTVFRGTQSVGEAISSFFDNLVSSILSQMATLLANQAFQWLLGSFPGGLPGGGGGGFHPVQGGGGGGFGTALGGIGSIVGSIIPGVGTFLGGAIGSVLGGFFQTGGDRVITRPTLIGVGETGPEMLSVRPLNGRRAGAGSNINFFGPTILDDLTLAQFERRIARAAGAEFGRVV